jgi:hypothetical protein
MTRTAYCVVFLLVLASPVMAQPRFYGGASLAADSGGRGQVDVGTFPAAGGLVGWRFSDGWSLEFHLDHGFGEGPERVSEGLLFSQLGGLDRERTGVFARSTWQDRPSRGFAVLAVWKARLEGRADVAFTMGVSERRFRARHTTTITGVGPDVTYPPDHPNLQDRDESRILAGGGLAGGLLVPVKVAGAVTVAPELRMTLGLISDESAYKQFYAGVRMMWGS